MDVTQVDSIGLSVSQSLPSNPDMKVFERGGLKHEARAFPAVLVMDTSFNVFFTLRINGKATKVSIKISIVFVNSVVTDQENFFR